MPRQFGGSQRRCPADFPGLSFSEAACTGSYERMARVQGTVDLNSSAVSCTKLHSGPEPGILRKIRLEIHANDVPRTRFRRGRQSSVDLLGDVAGAFDGTVDGGPGYTEKFGDFTSRVRSRPVNGNQVCFLGFGEFGLFSA